MMTMMGSLMVGMTNDKASYDDDYNSYIWTYNELCENYGHD